eukprot:TRINITY_DN2331_c0_g1_i1.p1 TRINITY_DN2331_c0_g1~~TRINITY_DN2331_c0_g1_i1.p1  ORF type:complete len:321 (-),score=41.61 TRINITY_DN2331_c0_g1_i1:174-1136(-)
MGWRASKVMLVSICFSLEVPSEQKIRAAVAQRDSQEMSAYAVDLLDGALLLQIESNELRRVADVRDSRQQAAGSGEAVFLVGNGVLTEQQRDMLVNAPAHRVYRFNGMPGLRKLEPVGNVFVRSFGGDKENGYWGLSCCYNQNASCSLIAKRSNACSRISEALSVILLGGTSTKADKFVRSCKDEVPIMSHVLDATVAHLNGRKYVSSPHYCCGWSSGLLGFAHLRANHPHDDIHIMGMNWAAGIEDPPHPFTVERGIISETTGVSVRIHETGTDVYHDTNVTVCECSETQVANSIVDERGIQKVASDVAATCSHGGSLL